jgi:UDP-N-acetylglucosamine 1-carboxyvinyltransferase
MNHEHLIVERSRSLAGTVELSGAKNAVLVIMTSLILTSGKSRLTNVPASRDVYVMIELLSKLGIIIAFDPVAMVLDVDTSYASGYQVPPELMKQIRASFLIMGPLLARYGKASIGLPGGDRIGARPLDLHMKAFARMGVSFEYQEEYLVATSSALRGTRYVLDYPSVGATENILMAAVLIPGVTEIVNAAQEPEVLDLIAVLTKMGAIISFDMPSVIRIEGVPILSGIEHEIMPDRLEAGTFLLAAAITGGSIMIPRAPVASMELFLEKLYEMGHDVILCNLNSHFADINFKATLDPRPISFKTMPYPGFPTDLQAPIMAALTLVPGMSVIHETVFESRMHHVHELHKMGAHIELVGDKAKIHGVSQLVGTSVFANDVRAGACLVLAGLVAQGTTFIAGVEHVQRGYHDFDKKLAALGASVTYSTPPAKSVSSRVMEA